MDNDDKKLVKKENIKGVSKKKIGSSSTIKSEIKPKAKRVKSEEKDINNDLAVKEVVAYKNNGFNLIEVILIMIITLFFGGIAGGIIVYTAKVSHQQNSVIGNDIPVELNEFIKVYGEIKQDYYENLDEKKLLDAGIKGMIDYLGDPYSNYMSPDQTEAFNQTINGEYDGIGVELIRHSDGRTVVGKVFENSPALVAGLKTDDQIIKVENTDITNLSASEIVALIKNKDAVSVKLTIKRKEELITIQVTKDKIEIPSVISSITEKDSKKVGTLKINIFASNTFIQFEKLLKQLQEDKIDSLIIDVRDNSGGHLKVVEDIASLFIPKGKIIYQLETKGVKQPVYSKSNTEINIPVIILINKNSASASEILASAMKESYGATLVGENTYGKGTVQTAKQLSSGATIKYTIQKWLTPNANWINGTGIAPDEMVKQGDEYLSNPSSKTDTQFQKAMDLIK
ncbi:MAG: S41 family peptidase [Bacilli bacterium]